jgi:hypothetical protein
MCDLVLYLGQGLEAKGFKHVKPIEKDSPWVVEMIGHEALHAHEVLQ